LTSTSSSAWSVFADLLDPPENPYVEDPVGWVRDRLGEFLWSKQREILEALVRHRYVAVKALTTPARATVPREQLHGGSIREKTRSQRRLRRRPSRFPRFCGGISAKLIERATFLVASRSMTSGTWAGAEKSSSPFGRKPADHDQSAFQGIHALNPLILVDEACGVPKSIFDAVDALATNSNARVFRSATLTIPRRTSHTSASPDRAGM
jgi:hypothetical protein